MADTPSNHSHASHQPGDPPGAVTHGNGRSFWSSSHVEENAEPPAVSQAPSASVQDIPVPVTAINDVPSVAPPSPSLSTPQLRAQRPPPVASPSVLIPGQQRPSPAVSPSLLIPARAPTSVPTKSLANLSQSAASFAASVVLTPARAGSVASVATKKAPSTASDAVAPKTQPEPTVSEVIAAQKPSPPRDDDEQEAAPESTPLTEKLKAVGSTLGGFIAQAIQSHTAASGNTGEDATVFLSPGPAPSGTKSLTPSTVKSGVQFLSPAASLLQPRGGQASMVESRAGMGMPIGRKGSHLDAPAVRIDKRAIKEVKEKHKERQQTVQVNKELVAKASQMMKEQKQLDELKRELTMTEHLMTVEELCKTLEVDVEYGLTDNVVTHRLVRDGPNALPPKKETPGWLLWVKMMCEGFSLLLWVGGLLAIIAYSIQSHEQPHTPQDNLYLGIVLLCVVFITTTFSYLQEAKSSSIMNSFLKMAPQFAAVIRNGEKMAIVSSELVVGDVVELKAGDKIPADVRIVENRGLKVDNASLTGESEPLNRSVESTHENPLETKNLAFFSTYAVEGSAIGIVVRTGERTIMGRIAKLAASVEVDLTPLAIEMRRFVKLMTGIATTMGVIMFVVFLAQGQKLISAFVFLIGVIVANVPEGVLPATTVALALTAKRMAKENCLVKNLGAVETLGSTSVICSDKTGTLTQNRMTVAHLWVNNVVVESDTTEDQSKKKMSVTSLTTKALIRCAALCNRAVFKPDQDAITIMKRETVGDASESALLKFTDVHLGDTVAYRNKNPKVSEIPFNSTNKYQISIHEAEEYNGELLLVMKGAPERIIERCTFVEFNGDAEPISVDWQQHFNEAYEALGGLGERVLGFAELRLPAKKFPKGFVFDTDKPNFPLKGLHFLGLISLIDPPRAAVPAAVATCREAGVRVIMVTGDHPITAKAIARTVGIISPESETVEDIAKRLEVSVQSVDPTRARAAVVTGTMLKEMQPEELDFILRTHPELVFARTSPQQKLIIVEGVQRSGAIVAVTGDGVNDSPALRKANIGIAMGITGSDVSKDAAKMILLDDNFASVVIGIEEGRLIFDNLRKTIAYMLTSNIPEIIPFLIAEVCGIPQAINTAGMLYIDLGTDIVPAIAMAYEKSETDIMSRPPRDPKRDKIVNKKVMFQAYLQIGVMQTLAGYITYFVVFAENGFWPMALLSGLHGQYNNEAKNDVLDSYGQEWTYYQRKELLLTVQASFFLTVVITQWVNLINCKCRKMSIFQKGMSNHVINFALLFETALVCAILYIPGLNVGMQMRPAKLQWWTVGIFFNLLIFLWDEVRRWFVRHYPRGFLYRETFY